MLRYIAIVFPVLEEPVFEDGLPRQLHASFFPEQES